MMRVMLLAACALLAGCDSRESVNPADPAAYAVRLPVIPAPGGSLQRIAPPAEALAALRSSNRADLRLFDASGAVLPMAMTAPAGGRAAISDVRLDAFPILGPAGALKADGSVLSIRQQQGDRIVTVTQAAGADSRPVVLGALFDARAIDGRARSLRLDARFPAQQPISFQVESSRDLEHWSSIGGRTLYRASAAGAGALGPEMIPLGEAELKDRYLRLSWSSPSRLLGPVEIKAAVLTVARKLDGDDRPAIETSPPQRIDAHDIRFTLPRPAVIAAVALTPMGGEMLVPVRISGRNTPDQGWTLLGTGIVRAGTDEPVALSGTVFTDYRIEADRRTGGFATPPGLRLFYEPAEIITLFSGKPPYTLAAGVGDAENRYLKIGELIPNYRPGAERALPAATIRASAAPRLTLAVSDDRLFTPRKVALWGILLLGVAALAFMIWRLWRPTAAR